MRLRLVIPALALCVSAFLAAVPSFADDASSGGLTADCCPGQPDCGAGQRVPLIEDFNRTAKEAQNTNHLDDLKECLDSFAEAWQAITNFKLTAPTSSQVKNAVKGAMEDAAKKVAEALVAGACAVVTQYTDAADMIPYTLEGKLASDVSSKVSADLRGLLDSDVSKARSSVPTYRTPDISGDIARGATAPLHDAHDSASSGL